MRVLNRDHRIVEASELISIVDDDESIGRSTKALVRSLGHSARTFASAEEFLDSDPDETDCLILDVQMTGLSGVELLERLTAEGRQLLSFSSPVSRIGDSQPCA